MQRRKTASQTAVLRLFREQEGALSHDMIEKQIGKKLNRSTIYRILNRFVDDGRLHRIVGSDGRQYFALCGESCGPEEHQHNHLHFRCIACERVECLPQPLKLNLPAGYEPKEVNATVAGYCADCTAEG